MASSSPPAAPEPAFSAEDDRLFLALEDYCWEDDPEFQSGLTQILGATTDPAVVRQLTRQAKCFFYARKIAKPISFPLYAAWLDREESSAAPRRRSPSPSRESELGPALGPTPIDSVSRVTTATDTPTSAANQTQNTAPDGTPYPISFAQIVELITSGKPIPGIKEIPNTLNSAPPTQSTAQQRRKPWETSTPSSTVAQEQEQQSAAPPQV
ncbi:hypothetical protein Dda_2996 [Drechslerella dactyloides]|uniref:Uncharacterized protein n=1 Tax=Drechslerella dactyloides TaxID=74499 RepID=A0AAD6J130_DREDA|nr:hypothetical protein Dda_2996 [Drechslerella dactyloides]